MQLQLECAIDERIEMEKNQARHLLLPSDPTSVFLLCPLSTGVCLEDCKPTPNVHNITCEELEPQSARTGSDRSSMTRASRRIRYQIPQVTGRHNGTWVCQNKGVSSERHELKVSDAPYIESLTANRNPVAAGSTVRLTCIVAPTPTAYELLRQRSRETNRLRQFKFEGIQFAWHRLRSKVDTGARRSPIVNRVEQPDAFTSSLEVHDLRYEEGTVFECTAEDSRGRRAVRQIQLDVHYTPKSIHIETIPAHDRPVQAGTRCHILCTAESSNPAPTFNLLRRRVGQSQAYLMEDTAFDGPSLGNENVARQAFAFQLTEQDNGASFFCEVITHGVMETVARSDGRQFNVTYPPQSIFVTMDPVGSVAESVSKVFTCQLNASGSNPPSELTWTQLDSAGALIPLKDDIHVQSTDQIVGEFGALIARSVLTVVARRSINGRRFECTAIYQGKKTMLRAEEILEVKFAPNNVGLTALPMDGVRESQRLDLTCATSSCHPPATIRWFEVPNHGSLEEEEGSWTIGTDPTKPNELTDLAQMDTKPGKFGGTEVSSKLTVTKTYRLHQGTVFRCLVEHPAMEKPVISEHRLQVLYPTVVQLISHPPEPVVGQTVLLSCQTSGGNPLVGFTYTWFAADRFQLAGLFADSANNDSNRIQDASKSSMTATSSVRATGGVETRAAKRADGAPALKNMLRLLSQQEAYLNLTKVRLSQRGWYACQVASAGGVSHSTYFLDLFYQPQIDRRTRSRVQAHVGESVAFKLFIDANPPWAEAIWFQLNTDEQSIHPSLPTPLSNGRGSDTYFVGYHHNPYMGYDELYDYGMELKRKRRLVTGFGGKTRTQVGSDNSDRSNIIAGKGSGEQGNLTFILSFNEVRSEDFGDYVCQLRHKLGVQEFPFQLLRKSEVEGILPSSVVVQKRGPTTVVRFRPPGNLRFSRLVLRVCRRGAISASAGRVKKQTTNFLNRGTPSPGPYGLHRRKRRSPTNEDSERNDTTSESNLNFALGTDGPTRTAVNKDCEDYLVAKPHTGETEVHLSEAVQLYNFRLILYQGTRILQETPSVVWQPEFSNTNREARIPMIALAVTGGCLVLILVLIVAAAFFVCQKKRKSTSFSGSGKTKEGYATSINSPEAHGAMSEDSDMHRLRACGLAFEMRSDMGSIRSYQPSEIETMPLMQQMLGQGVPAGGYDPRNGGLTPTRSSRNLSLTDGDYGMSQGQHRLSHTSSHGTNMTMLSNRVITEAYLAAARAASEAVAASVVSGSTDLYSPSTQMTSDVGSMMAESGVDGDKEPNRTSGSNNHRHSHPSDGNETTATMGPKAMRTNTHKSNDVSKIRQGMRNSNSASPDPSSLNQPEMRPLHQAPHRGSRLSVQMGTRSSRSHSQCGSVSGNSLSSLRNPSQLSLEAAARAAAAAAVASVMRNMNVNLFMQHAASSTNLINPYTLRRPSSRAASVIGQTNSVKQHKVGNGSGDGESLHSAAFGSRFIGNPGSSTGEITPTASLNHFDPNNPPQGPQQLTVPTLQQAQMAQRSCHQIRNDPRQAGTKLQRPTLLHQLHGLPPLDTSSSKGSSELYKAHSPSSTISDRGQNSLYVSYPQSPNSPPAGLYGFIGQHHQPHALIQPVAGFRVPPQTTLNQYQLQQLHQLQLHHQRQQLLQAQQQPQNTTDYQPARSLVTQIQTPAIITSPPASQLTPAQTSPKTGVGILVSQPPSKTTQSGMSVTSIKNSGTVSANRERVSVHETSDPSNIVLNSTQDRPPKLVNAAVPEESRGVGEGQMEESMFLVRDDPASLGPQSPETIRLTTMIDKSEQHGNANKNDTKGNTTNHEIDDESSATTPISGRRHPEELLNHCGDISDLDGTPRASTPGIPSARQPPMGAASYQLTVNGCLRSEDHNNRNSQINSVHSAQNSNATLRQNQQPGLGVQSTLLADRSNDRLPSSIDFPGKTAGHNEDRKFLQTKLVQQTNGDNSPRTSPSKVGARVESSK
ncbi:hypothetical protein D915_000418 [Fasciola hepatica]|uniref:Ig-like domain-containing protein n=1 Tax=Fasciola hepatica TaxID=6192 RepID=A0A4E0RP05_FASHE|nr:hypothetical protein D915_000418 [Fasciola hepatica]